MKVVWEKDLNRHTVREAYARLRRELVRTKDSRFVLALGPDVSLDSAGVGLLEQLRREAEERGKTFVVATESERVRSVLAIYEAPPAFDPVVDKPVGFFERVGDGTVLALEQAAGFLVITADMLALGLKGLFRPAVSWRVFTDQCVRIGSQSLPIIALISFLIGLTTALQAAYQLKQFGANIYIANLVGVAMVAEMGPLMTAILLAGRSGSAIAAEISTMVIAEEVDALKTMGINPLRYVLLPRFYALVFTQPLLTVMATAIGISGGLLVGVLYLDLSVSAFWTQLVDAVAVRDLIQAMLKSVCFAVIIGLVAGHVGFRASGGATGVGRSTTASVVASIFLVIVADAAFSLIFYFGV